MMQQSQLREAVMPDGSTVFCLREREATVVYDQVRHYFRNGVELKPGATVFDIGANIGLFSLHAHQMCERNVRLFAFEPIPATYRALEANVGSLRSGELKTFHCGLGANAGSTEFSFYPHHTTLSTAYGDTQSEAELKRQLTESIVRNLKEAPAPVRWAAWLPPFLRSRLIRWMTQKSFDSAESVTCELRTVSDVIREHGVERIDLLKVDAEKSELDVLHGIQEEDWPKIQQVVMEIHDLDGRLQAIESLLEAHGIDNITVEQEPALKGSNVFSLFAVRGVDRR